MTEPASEQPIEQPNGSGIEPFDFSRLRATDEAPIDEPGKPDHKASRPKRAPLFNRKPAGDKPETPAKRTAASKARKTVPNRKGQFVEPLTGMYTTIGLVLMPVDPVCANAVLQSAERCAEALDDLAYRNEAVRRAIFALVNTSALGAVIAAHLPILMAIVMHHVPAAQRALGSMGQQMAENIAQQMEQEDNPGGDNAA